MWQAKIEEMQIHFHSAVYGKMLVRTELSKCLSCIERTVYHKAIWAEWRVWAVAVCGLVLGVYSMSDWQGTAGGGEKPAAVALTGPMECVWSVFLSTATEWVRTLCRHVDKNYLCYVLPLAAAFFPHGTDCGWATGTWDMYCKGWS